MWQEERVVPMRTRGPRRAPELGEAERPRRERIGGGAVRTSGTGPQAKRGARGGKVTLEELMAGMRKTFSPLTIVIQGWGSDEATTLMTALSPLLGERDAVWLIPADNGYPPTSDERAIVLSSVNNLDNRIKDALYPDLVLCPGNSQWAGQVGAWRDRVSVLAVAKKGSNAQGVPKAAQRVAVRTYVLDV